MQKFWYHSPVRFYRTIEELEDMTNPQNTQYYGHVKPYPLEVNSYHRYLIPNYQNEVEDTDLSLFLIGDNVIQIPCEFGVSDGKLFRITFISSEEIQGHFEIRDSTGIAIFYSNCVRFTDSSMKDGRKYIRVATQCNYNRNLFSFADNKHDWIITNLPAYCMGEFDIDEDIKSAKTGNLGSTKINSAWIEENVSYKIRAEGDNNILSFIAVHSTNQDFYIDGTKRTRKEKPETTDFTNEITMKFSNMKDENGLNIIFDEDAALSDVFKKALATGELTAVYVYNSNYIIPTEHV
ncbi:hypothetical protein [Chryseobacterium aquifrigidense]|uniref:Uncharacterized protein n=1 Tax=Chryseobacterium aquifrigidense TaxID=558021 RepID=A0A543E9R2_9FLAO|nr:hypothetical protein [Chryseobacterium aquifrigidense]TQM18340.1 hypothetical protein FB551_4121 [Chryseobacterium aquifrigidense]